MAVSALYFSLLQ
jgi:hypothetical protein